MRDSTAPTRRRASLGLVLAAVALAGAIAVACYDLPKPTCGFRCGPANECPTDYTCDVSDGHCHLNGAAPMACGPLLDDAAVPIDGATDAPDGPPDGPIDAPTGPPDAPPDAPIDAPPDAPTDAPPDAPIDAPPDAAI